MTKSLVDLTFTVVKMEIVEVEVTLSAKTVIANFFIGSVDLIKRG